MHFHAIQRSERPPAFEAVQDEPDETSKADVKPKSPSSPAANRTKKVSRYGHDDAADSQIVNSISDLNIANVFPSYDSSRRTGTDTDQEDNGIAQRQLQVQMPTSSPGLTTFAYQRALLNRISAPKLSKEGTYDLTKFTPIFIHDALMLPGSLASLLSKGSSEDILNRMTPGLLPGHHAHINSETLQPCLVRSSSPQAYVQGMLIFGQGKASRDMVHQHYRPGAKRREVGVEVDVWVRIPPHERETTTELWRLERRSVQAHAWIWSGDVEGCKGAECRDWTIEDCLAGNLEDDLPMRVETDGKGDEDEENWPGEEGSDSVSGAARVGEREQHESAKQEESISRAFERETWFE
jgi:hypothetical protein